MIAEISEYDFDVFIELKPENLEEAAQLARLALIYKKEPVIVETNFFRDKSILAYVEIKKKTKHEISIGRRTP